MGLTHRSEKRGIKRPSVLPVGLSFAFDKARKPARYQSA